METPPEPTPPHPPERKIVEWKGCRYELLFLGHTAAGFKALIYARDKGRRWVNGYEIKKIQ